MECWHMSGAGNDFMVVDGRGQALDYANLAVALCKKNRGGRLYGGGHLGQGGFSPAFLQF